MLGKKSIQKFGKIYAYLQNVDLRLKEIGKQRMTIQGALFTDEKFDDEWSFFDFVDCDFDVGYNIGLDWLVDCTFTNCNFSGHLGMGDAEDVKFINCAVDGNSTMAFSIETTGLAFNGCKFINHNPDRNHAGAFISSRGEVSFIKCRGKYFAFSGHKKLVLRNYISEGRTTLGTALPGLYDDISQMPYSDFLLEDCDFTRGVELFNPYLTNLTMRNCKAGVFQTKGSEVRGDVLVEDIKEGHVNLSASKFQGKLTVRNCSFFTTFREHSFRCGGCIPTHTLLENITCGSSPVDVVSTFGPREEWKTPPPNKSFIIRDCKIPRLHVDWAQTEHLRIENCQLGHLFIRNGRIGKLEIIDCSLMHLDVSDTQVQSQDVRIPEGGKISGHVTVTKGSNIKLLPR